MLPLFGLASVPMWATPWASLLITSLLIPKARCGQAFLGGQGQGQGQRRGIGGGPLEAAWLPSPA